MAHDWCVMEPKCKSRGTLPYSRMKGPAAPDSVVAHAQPSPPKPAPASAAAAGGQAALLADLNRGGSVTSGLRKVDPSQMTHKNAELRTTGTVPDKKTPPAIKAKPVSFAKPKKAPKTELEDGSKWIIVSTRILDSVHGLGRPRGQS